VRDSVDRSITLLYVSVTCNHLFVNIFNVSASLYVLAMYNLLRNVIRNLSQEQCIQYALKFMNEKYNIKRRSAHKAEFYVQSLVMLIIIYVTYG
jgi:hypothetical protein